MKISYEIARNLFNWTLWKNIETERGVGCFKVLSGTRKECRKKLEEINGTGTGETKSKKQRIRRKQSSTLRKDKATKKRVKEER